MTRRVRLRWSAVLGGALRLGEISAFEQSPVIGTSAALRALPDACASKSLNGSS
jgi:hypothetical protein